MKNRLTLVLGVLVVMVLLAYMFFFQVRFNEVAVLTTFDRATLPQYNADGTLARNPDGSLADPGSLRDKPGLYPRWPYPIQKVETYSKRIQHLDGQVEELQTRDGHSIVIRTFLTWRIEDPHAFFVSLKNTDDASRYLQTLLKEMGAVIGRYEFSQIVNTDSGQLKLREIENEALAQIRRRLAESEPKRGIKVEHLGIRRIVLPEKVTETVFNRMRTSRERLAQEARSTGDAQAAAIRSEAYAAQRTILSFAERRAQAIRAEGDRNAAEHYTAFRQDEEFAIFLRQIEALKKILSHNTTFVLNAADSFPFDILTTQRPPSAAQGAATAERK